MKKQSNRSFMKAAHASHLKSWRESGMVQSVKIAGSADGPCAECRNFLDRSYGLYEVPELPNRRCTTPGGCRCALPSSISFIRRSKPWLAKSRLKARNPEGARK